MMSPRMMSPWTGQVISEAAWAVLASRVDHIDDWQYLGTEEDRREGSPGLRHRFRLRDTMFLPALAEHFEFVWVRP